MDGASTDSKVNLLFKEANNTVDVVRYEPFTNPQNAYPFQNYVQNDEIFSNPIPSNSCLLLADPFDQKTFL